MGEVEEVIGTLGHPYTPFEGESLANTLIKFKDGRTGSLYCHYMNIPMTQLPFFQIFGNKVGSMEKWTSTFQRLKIHVHLKCIQCLH